MRGSSSDEGFDIDGFRGLEERQRQRHRRHLATYGVKLRFRSLMRRRSKASDMMRFCPLSSAISCPMARGSMVGPIGVMNPSFAHAA
jgi:hypothetical protein